MFKKKKVDAYEIVVKESILGGLMDTTVIAGCLEDAVDKAMDIFKENVSKEDLELVSVKKFEGLTPLNKKEIEI